MTQPLDALADRWRAPSLWRLLALPVFILLIVFFIWAGFSRFDQVVIAPGSVAPSGQVRVVQHLEGGVITAIRIHEGDKVKPGDELVQLQLGAESVNRDELNVRLDALLAQRVRERAEADGVAPAFPSDLTTRRPDIVAAEQATWKQRQAELNSGLAELDAQIESGKREIETATARKNAATASLGVAKRQLDLDTGLIKDKLVSRTEAMEREAEVRRLEGEIATDEATGREADANLVTARAKRASAVETFRRQATEAVTQADIDIARNQAMLKTADQQQARTMVTSPIVGIVQNLRFNTIGGVVKPGEPILEIVPTEERMQIEARLTPLDIGHVEVGQKATIKLTPYDYLRYGGLDGTVEQVAAKSDTDADHHPYFRVVIRTSSSYLQSGTEQFPIIPGMDASVDIHTGTRSLLSFLIQPVLKLRSEAFRER